MNTAQLFTSARTCAWVFVMCAAGVVRADLLVANTLGSSSPALGPGGVCRYRESDGAYLGVVAQGGEIIGGVALGPEKNVYIAAEDLDGALLGEILRFDPTNGAPLGALVTLGQNGLSGSIGPSGLAFSNGSVFTCGSTTSPAGNGALRFSATTGTYLGVAVAPGSGGLGTPGDVLTMPGGDLLVMDGHRINRYNKTTFAFLGTFVAPGSGGLTTFNSAAFGPDGNLYVCDSHSIDRFDGINGAFLDAFVPSTAGPCEGLAFGLDGNLYSTTGSRILRYDGTTGAFLDTFVNDPVHLNGAFRIIAAPAVPEPAMAGIAIAGATAALRRRSITCR